MDSSYGALVLAGCEIPVFQDILISSGTLTPQAAQIVTELEAMFEMFPFFARHFMPRKDQANLYGKSWQEILGISRYKFNKYFDEIGVHYKSMQEMPEKIEDRFQGKYYYRVRNLQDHNRTYYFRNYGLIRELLWGTYDEENFDMGVEE